MSGVDSPVDRHWSAQTIGRLLNTVTCPVCEQRELVDRRCTRCGADLNGPEAAELWDASQSAAAALGRRQAVVARVPRVRVGAPAPSLVRAGTEATPGTPRAMSDATPRLHPRANATVQSVLALAGAGLVAVAGIIFTFFNPDVTDNGSRSVIVGGITLVFVGGAWVLVRRGLRFSAEATGALALVFVALDVNALAGLAPQSPWALAALGTLVAGTIMAVLGVRLRLRVWLWTSLLALSFTPLMAALAVGGAETASVGWVATAAAASAMIELTARLGLRFGVPLTAERVALTIIQASASVVALVVMLLSDSGSATAYWLEMSGLLASICALSVFSARHLAGALWSYVGGTAGGLAIVVLPLALSATLPGDAMLALVPTAGAVGLLLVGAVLPTPGRLRRGLLLGGAVTAATLSALPALATGAIIVLTSLAGVFVGIGSAYVVTGLTLLAAGLQLFSRIRRSASTPGRAARHLGDVGLWIAVCAALVLVCAPELVLSSRLVISLTAVVATAVALNVIPALRAARSGVRVPLLVGAHLLLLATVITSWQDAAIVVWAGIAAVAALGFVVAAVPSALRPVHIAVGYAYLLLMLATALSLSGVDAIEMLCLTTSAGAVLATATTFLRAVPPRIWTAILAVTSVPFAIGVAQVFFERSGWTALSTAPIFFLALALVVTRRPGLGVQIRAFSAALLVPSLAVVIVCLGAQLLPTSGSPVVLPIIAVVSSIALAATTSIESALVARVGARHARIARLSIEASTLLTAAIAVVLSLVRQSAGLGTALIVLVVLGVGGCASAAWTGRRYGWWLAGAAFTGALWSVWGMAGVVTPEPFLLPPALTAAVVGAVLTARGGRGAALYGTGLAVAILPVMAVLAAQGSVSRGLGLVAAAWLLLGAGGVLGVGGLGRHRMHSLQRMTFGAAIVAGASGAVLAIRVALGLEADILSTILIGMLVGMGGAIPAAVAARLLRAGADEGSRLACTRWLFAPPVVYVAVSAWPAIHRDWVTIWSMWALMLAFLLVMVATSVRQRRRRTGLPPVWFLFAISFLTAVVAWSPRDLRVEWFSIPLGLSLLLAGTLHVGRSDTSTARTANSWPAGFAGSWELLAPGIVVTLSASVAATLTDPVTWRAILVLILALACILVGSSARLAAPFIIGIVVLPVENVMAFLVQIGRGIESMPWWITLTVVGAVLLIIAVTYERREGEGAGIAARLRDLR